MLGVGLLWNGGGSMSETLTTARRAMLHRRVRFIVGFTITYNVIEAIVAVWAGVLASSAALIGFGLDSVVEVLSAAAVTWQFTRKDPERWETVTVKAIGIAFFALAAYVSIDAVLALVGQEGPDRSPLGLGITALSLVVSAGLISFTIASSIFRLKSTPSCSRPAAMRSAMAASSAM